MCCRYIVTILDIRLDIDSVLYELPEAGHIGEGLLGVVQPRRDGEGPRPRARPPAAVAVRQPQTHVPGNNPNNFKLSR